MVRDWRRQGSVIIPLQTRHGTKPRVFYIRRGRICAVIFSSGRYYRRKEQGTYEVG